MRKGKEEKVGDGKDVVWVVLFALPHVGGKANALFVLFVCLVVWFC